jgi:hypothetical protein
MIEYHFICGGCRARNSVSVQRVTTPLFKSQEAFAREGGLCTHSFPTVEDKLPDGWGFCLLGVCYCKECFEAIYPPNPSDQRSVDK